MWRSGERLDVQGGLSQRLRAVLNHFSSLYDNSLPSTEADVEDAQICLRADYETVNTMQTTEGLARLSREGKQHATQIQPLYQLIGEHYLEALEQLYEYVQSGEPGLPSTVLFHLERADGLLERADSLNQNCGESDFGTFDTVEVSDQP